jgi:signal transduction histidine kinase/methanogenic corrinoid protein MtbC1
MRASPSSSSPTPSSKGRAAAVDIFLGHVERGDREEAVRQAVAVVEGGGHLDEAVEGLLAPVQVEVGRRWETATWSVAQEHAATAIVDDALAAVGTCRPQVPSRGRVLVACVEGEWHTVPARMLAEQLRARGWSVTFLGGSMPADQLEGHLRQARPDALLLSCSVAMSLVGAARSIEAARRVQVPVLVGGRGFGDQAVAARRASAVGADACAPTAAAAAAVLDRWVEEPPQQGPPTPPALAALELATCRSELVDAAVDELFVRFPTLASYDDRLMAHTRADFGYIIDFAAAAVEVGDPAVLEELVVWLQRVLGARHVPGEALALGLESLGVAASRLDVAVLAAVLRQVGFDPAGTAETELVAPPDRRDRHARALVELVEAQRETIAALRDAFDHQREAGLTQRASVGALAHEVGTPLVAVIGMLELIAGGETPGVPADELAARALRQAEHLRAVVEDFLDNAPTPEGVPVRRATLVWVDAADLVEEVVEAARPVLGGRVVERSVAPGLRIRTVPNRVRQILLNLVANAAKHSPEGAVIDVEADRDGGWVRLMVSDRGGGIPPELVERMFRPFEQGPGGAEAGGMGLGLYLVRRLAESLGGTVDLSAREGGGTVARAMIPQLREEDLWQHPES